MARIIACFILACIACCGVRVAEAAGRVQMVIGGMAEEPAADASSRDGDSVVIEQGSSFPLVSGSPRVLIWTSIVDDVARLFKVDSALLMAVIEVESGGNRFAVSPKGARGLMQLMPQTGAMQGADDLFDPWQNIVAGARLLNALLVTWGNVPLALAAYNAGERAVRKYGGAIPPYAETQRYVRQVIEKAAWYRREARG